VPTKFGQRKLLSSDSDRTSVYPYAPRFSPLPIPAEDICDQPLVCISLNSTWAGFVSGLMEVLRHKDMWIGSDEQIQSAIDNVERIDAMFSFPCGDNGISYHDYIQQEAIYQQMLVDRYDGTPQSVDEDAPTTTFGGDENPADVIYRDDALCHAYKLLVDISCEQIYAAIQDRANALRQITTILFAFGPLGAVMGLLIWITIEAANAIVNIETLRNLDAREKLACCLYETAKGQAVSFENYRAAMVSCRDGFAGGSPERAIANALVGSSAYTNQGNYIAFLKILANAFRFSKAGILEPCSCAEWTIKRLFFDGQAYGNANIEAVAGVSDGNVLASYNAGNDRYEAGINDLNADRIGVVRMVSSLPFRVTKVRMKYNLNFTTANTRTQVVWANGVGVDTLVSKDLTGDVFGEWLESEALNIDVFELHFRWSAGGTGGAGWAFLEGIEIQGRGTMPDWTT
jgi:hypothetical protein